MKTILKNYLVLFSLFISANILANGDRGGNGGGAWVCYNKNKDKIRKIKLIDFFEAEKQHKLTIETKYSPNGVNNILFSYQMQVHDFSSVLHKELNPLFSQIYSKIDSFEDPEIEHEKIPDLDNTRRPSAAWCRKGVIDYQVIANFTDEGKIEVNNPLYYHKEFSNLERAGLLLHEVIYYYTRTKYNDVSSKRARHIVGIIASTLSRTEKLKELKKLMPNLR